MIISWKKQKKILHCRPSEIVRDEYPPRFGISVSRQLTKFSAKVRAFYFEKCPETGDEFISCCIRGFWCEYFLPGWKFIHIMIRIFFIHHHIFPTGMQYKKRIDSSYGNAILRKESGAVMYSIPPNFVFKQKQNIRIRQSWHRYCYVNLHRISEAMVKAPIHF